LENIVVWNLRGKTEYKVRLKALKQTPGFEQNVVSLGIVRDADDNANAALQSVQGALRGVDLPAPKQPLRPASGTPRVTIMILPGEGKPGMLEDLCLEAVEAEPAMTCVMDYFECLGQKELSLPRNLTKAKVQVFLGSRGKVALRVGEAAQAGYWPFDSQVFEKVKCFIREVSSKSGA